MRVSAFMALLTVLVLSSVALAGESSTPPGRAEASVLPLTDDTAILKNPRGEVPGLITYQGTLTDPGGAALDTTLSMTFGIYADSTGGVAIWTESQPAVVVSGGIFNVLLGRVNSLSDTVFNDPERWLGIQVGSDEECEPRQRIAAVGYALRAAMADTALYARGAPAVDDGDWTVNGSYLYSAVTGNVGIGTASPVRKLHVVGDLKVEGAASLDDVSMDAASMNSASMVTAVVANAEMTHAQAVHLQAISATVADSFTMLTGAADGYVLTSDASGLGSWQPVDSVMYADSSEYARAAGADGDWTILGSDLYSTVSGNVGIGTASPVRKLHVVGDLKVEGAASLDDVSMDDVSMDDATMHAASIISASMAKASMDSAQAVHLQAITANLNSAAIYEASVLGKLGIGTPSPARSLHVTDVIRLEPTTAPSSPSEGDIYMDSTTHKLMVYDGTDWQACW